MTESQKILYDNIKKKYDQIAEEEYNKLINEPRIIKKEDTDITIKRILTQVLLDKGSLKNQESAKKILEPMSELANTIKEKEIQQEKFTSLSIEEVLKRLSNRIKDISIEFDELYSKERIERLSKIYKNEPISKVLEIIHIRKVIEILTKEDRMIYTGILFIFIALCLYFIFGTS